MDAQLDPTAQVTEDFERIQTLNGMKAGKWSDGIFSITKNRIQYKFFCHESLIYIFEINQDVTKVISMEVSNGVIQQLSQYVLTQRKRDAKAVRKDVVDFMHIRN